MPVNVLQQRCGVQAVLNFLLNISTVLQWSYFAWSVSCASRPRLPSASKNRL